MTTPHPWIIAHAPLHSSEIPHHAAMERLKVYLSAYKKQKKKAALIHGPVGTGKTTAVHVLARELGLEIIEVNASDFRNAAGIELSVGGAARQQSLFSSGKIILVDEIDGLSGKEDRGGVQALVDVIENTAFPIIMTATDPYDDKLRTVRPRSEMIDFETLPYTSVAKVLEKIATAEKIQCSDLALKGIARRAGGDIRAAINDLQSLAGIEVTEEHLSLLSERDKEESIHHALVKVFKNSDPAVALSAYDNLDMDHDEIMLWLDYNLPREYLDTPSLARAYDALSKAAVFKGRIRRWQHWRFLVYINALLSAGIAVAKDEKQKEFVKYDRSMRLLKIWQANMKNQKRKAIAQKLATATHTSTKRATQQLFYLRYAAQKKHSFASELSLALKLEKEEEEWLRS